MGHFAEKYPPGQAAATDSLLAFDSIDTPCSNSGGAAGTSGVDAYAWQTLCSSFGLASVIL